MYRTKRVTALILLAGGTAVLAACSGSSQSSPSSAAAGAVNGAAQPAAAAPSAAGPDGAAGNAKSFAGAGTTARVSGSAIVYTSELTVRVPRVTDAAAAAAQIAEGAGGYVSNETASSGSGASASVQLKIPVATYQATLSRLAGLGTQLALNRQAQDVTQQVADVNSQVTSDQAAIVQLRTLLTHAGSIGDLLTVQNQINSEESALESIESQQRALSGETAYATVTMTILGPKAKPPAASHHKPAPPPSLAGGLSAGWRAFRITVDWALAFLGAVAPFLAIGAAAAFGGYRARRWMLRRRAA